MPMSKPRSSKRGSSSSYTSTITTIVFVALCVAGVWMLTSSSVGPPQTTTTSRSSFNNEDDRFSSSLNDQHSHIMNKAENKKDGGQQTFEDNPGDLPDDAIKSEELTKSSQQSEDHAHQKEQEGSTADAVVDENTHGLQGAESVQEKEKQSESQTQISEESTITILNQQEEVENTQKTNEEIKEDQQKSNNDVTESSQNEKLNENPVEKEQTQQREEDNQKSINDVNKGTDPNSELPESTQNQSSELPESTQNQSSELPESTQNQSSDTLDSSQNQKSNETLIDKTFETEQKQQRVEDSGMTTTGTQDESQNVISDEDQQNRIKQQQQQEEQQQKQPMNPQSTADKTNSDNSEVTFSDETKQEATVTDLPQQISSNNETQQEQQQTQGANHQKKKKKKSKESTSLIQEAKEVATSDSTESIPDESNTGIPKESMESKKSWKTQAAKSTNEKERRKDGSDMNEESEATPWRICNVTAGPDYIPCLDNEKALKTLRTTGHFEHRERHCPSPEESPRCLVSLPVNYKTSIEWPKSRAKIWYHNVPHTKLAEVKGHQNWVKVTGEFLTFPGGGTQFIHGALHYIDFLQQSVPNIAWGKRTRVILDVGCGVASFGGFLFERNVIAMSFAPKDEHEAQVQFALERGIPAISAVMGSQRLPFPGRVFDLVHCARCRVPWHNEGGKLLLELNRVLRPGGYFVWSATPVYQTKEEDVQIWKAMSALTVTMCWELVTIKKDTLNGVGAAIYRKPVTNECYAKRKQQEPPMCKDDDDPNASWYVPLQACMHMAPVSPTERGSKWPEDWPKRLQTPPYWFNSSQKGIYGKPARKDVLSDSEHWKQLVMKVYMSELGISWAKVRNVMDMRAVYGGFAAALKDLQVWVMSIVNVDSPDTLPIIYERGLFGIYHDWCESFSTYPRTYDLLHADNLFSKLKKRCELVPVIVEVDRIVRPGGKLIVRDESDTIKEIEEMLKSLHWDVHITVTKNQETILGAQKGMWRPGMLEASS